MISVFLKGDHPFVYIKMEVTVLPANINDAPLLSKLGVITFEDTFSHLNTEENMRLYLSSALTVTTLEEELKDQDNRFFIAYADQVVAGYIKLRTAKKLEQLNNLNALEIERFYLLKQFHGTGIAQTMMKFCISTAQHDKADVLWLGVWKLNPRAIRFYEKLGFKNFGKQVFMMVEEKQWDQLMRLDIKYPL